MSITTIASRYAKSLIDLAVEQGKLEQVMEDIKLFNQVASNRDFHLLLKSPIVKTDKKLSVFKEIFAGKIDVLTMSFINILAKKGREIYLTEIDDEFIRQYKAIKQVSTVNLTTATELTDDAIKRIKSKLNDSPITDENLDLQTKVDEELIGGFIIEIGDRLFDASVSHKLSQFKKNIKDDKLVKLL